MKTIRKRLVLLAAAGSLTLLLSFVGLLSSSVVQEVKDGAFSTVFVVFTIVFIRQFIREYDRYQAARLIIDNKIMHIQVAKTEGQVGTAGASRDNGDFEVYISCFGVLLDSRIIKFNVDAIKLKGVEIGRDFVFLSYGNERATQGISILHGPIGLQELQRCIDRFCYETGINPVTLDL